MKNPEILVDITDPSTRARAKGARGSRVRIRNTAPATEVAARLREIAALRRRIEALESEVRTAAERSARR